MSQNNFESRLHEIDLICEQFEARWRKFPSDGIPQIDEFVQAFSAPPLELLDYLLPIDIEFRIKFKLPQSPEIYKAQLPTLAHVLQKVPAIQELMVRESSRNRSENTGGESDLDDASGSPKKIGDYHIVRQLGQGGMGVVFEATHSTLNRRVALKRLSQSIDDAEARIRFNREAQLAAQLHHTNIVPVFEFGQDGGVPFMAMQLIEGVDLKQWQADSENNDPNDLIRQVADIGFQAASALTYAHSKGVIHRDIKPANLMIDQSQNVWVTDFGLAKSFADDMTRTGNVVGTLRYLAPERLAGQCDDRADQYSLGATLYELIAGQPIVEAESHSELVNLILHNEPPRLKSLVPELPLDLDTIIHKSINKDAERRFATTQAMANDLHRFLNDEPIQARRMSILEKTIRYVRRNQAVALSLFGIAVLVIGLIGTLSWAYRSAVKNAETESRLKDENQASLYLAEMNLASPLASKANWTEGLSELVDHWTESCQLDPAKWEWHFFASICQQERWVYPAEENYMTLSVSWSPDDSMVAAGGEGLLLILNSLDGTAIHSMGINGRAFALEWQPHGPWIAVGTDTGHLMIWDSDTQSILATFQHDLPIGKIHWQPETDKLFFREICFQPDHMTTRLFEWNWAEQRIIEVTQTPAVGDKSAFAFTPRGTLAAVNSVTDESDYLIDILTTQPWQIKRQLPGPVYEFSDLEWMGSDFLATTSFDGKARIWDTVTALLLKEVALNEQPLTTLSVHPNRKKIAAAGYDRQIQAWNLDPMKLYQNHGNPVPLPTVGPMRLRGHQKAIRDVQWSHRGDQLVSVSEDGTIRAWKTTSLPLQEYSVGSEGNGSLFWHPNDIHLSTHVQDRNVVWKTDACTLAEYLIGKHVLESNDGSLKVICTKEHLKVVRGSQTLYEADGVVSTKELRWSPIRNQLALVLHSKSQPSAEIVSVDFTAKPEPQSLYKGELSSGAIAWSPDGSQLAYLKTQASDGHTVVCVYDFGRQQEIEIETTEHEKNACLAWSPDSKQLAFPVNDQTIRIKSLGRGESTDLVGHTERVLALHWHPDGQRLASGSLDATVRIWDIDSGKMTASFAHASAIDDVAWDASGNKLAVISRKGEVVVRNAGTSRDQVPRLLK